MPGRFELKGKQGRRALATRLGAIALATGACLCVWVFGKGNQEIFAIPLALWLGVSFWPKPTTRDTNVCRPADLLGRWRPTLLIAGIVGSWTAVVLGIRFPVRPPLVHSISIQSRIEVELSRAEQEYSQGKYAKAIERLDQLKVPAELPILKARLAHDRGIALLRLGNKPAATETFLQSLKDDSRNIEALCLLCEIALAQGDRSRARSYLDRALAIDNSYAFANELSGRMNAENELSHSRSGATP